MERDQQKLSIGAEAKVTKRAEARWKRAAEEHRAALRGFLETARGVEEGRWARSLAPGKWSPAQVAEHLALTYEGVLREVEGGSPLRVRLSAVHRALLRWLLLPHILFHRSFPLRAPAVRELRPEGEAHPARDAVLPRLEALGERFERELDAAWRAGGGRVTHPFFGSVPPTKALRFCAVHLEHHRRQLSA